MLYGSAGARDTAERGIYQGFQVLNATNAPITATVLGQPTTFEPGAAFVTGSNIPRNDNNEAAQVGLRLKGEGLGITHQLNMGYTHSRYAKRNAFERSAERRVGKSVSSRVDLGERRIIKKQRTKTERIQYVKLNI